MIGKILGKKAESKKENEEMEYKGYRIDRVDDRHRGWGVFEPGTGKFAWICESYVHEQYGLIVVANFSPFRTRGEAKKWIDDGFPIETKKYLVFAASREEAEDNATTHFTKSL